ncbi:MAG: hypothetical protein COX57_00525 [Alphaproteobacteria bacterium CG_4_10_14_0_2_um_filter_63_37]|nr:MAG: hypothetical protein AUJ55_05305 [Proteobacteria bacterium CG1_02_64_396]PJA25964.1 MAG: hypothetical protein COX57_00525 [Alphaproteobacteria bacterium CG_4_10_14_0_2_um_filter_63_37]
MPHIMPHIVSCPWEKSDRLLGNLISGDYFGDLSLNGGAPQQVTAQSVTPCRLYQWPSQVLVDLAERHPDIVQSLHWAEVVQRPHEA